MSEGLSSGLPPETIEALRTLSISEVQPAEQEERISLKDMPYVDVLEREPELEVAIRDVMDRLAQTEIDVPLFHITSRAIRFADGSERSTGYLESIQQHGLRARDTNVAALMERDASVYIAAPEYYAKNPHKFLRAMAESLSHYAHHGSRTNKETLGEQRDAGVGVPALVMIDASDVPLIPGSDYDDHFKLGEVVPPSRIVSVLDLAGRKPANPEDVADIAGEFIAAASKYADSAKSG
jgi:hypothetical protein